jgi:hypothetical protein
MLSAQPVISSISYWNVNYVINVREAETIESRGEVEDNGCIQLRAGRVTAIPLESAIPF